MITLQNTASVRVMLVRHGMTLWNKHSRYQGHTDVPLSIEGLEQAKRAAARLEAERITRIYSSDLSRAHLTAQVIACRHGLPVIRDPRLREIGFGKWEGLTYAEISQRWPELQKRWFSDPVSHTPPEAESTEDLRKRLEQALSDIYKDLVRCTELTPGIAPLGVIVAHGGVIRALISLSLTGSMRSLWSCAVSQASVTEGELYPDRLKITCRNDVSHLA